MREADFLARIQEAAGKRERLPHPGTYPGPVRTLSDDWVDEFCDRLTAVGGHTYRVEDPASARLQLRDILTDLRQREHPIEQAILSAHTLLTDLGLDGLLQRMDVQWAVFGGQHSVDRKQPPIVDRQPSLLNPRILDIAKAEIGLTGVEYAVAASGTIVVAASPAHPRTVSLLPPIHIAVVRQSQLLPDLATLAVHIQQDYLDGPPSGLALITGPSKTADIEQTLSIGVHGPGEVHVLLLEA